MYPYTQSELDAFFLLQTGMQVFHLSTDSQGSSYSSLGIIFVCLGIPKVHQESISKELGDMPIVALDDLGTDPLVCTHYVPVLFGIKLRGEFSGIDEVTEHDGELTAFSLGSGRGNRRRGLLDRRLLLCQRRWGGLGRRSRCVHGPFDIPCPHETSPLVVAHWMHVEKFGFEGFEILVIQAEPYLESWIRHTSLPFQEGDDLFEDVVECHGSASINASSCTIEQEQKIPRNHSKSGNASRESRSRIERACPGTRSMHPFCSNVTTIWCTAGAETLK